MSDALFFLQPAKEEDLVVLDAFAAAEGMGSIPCVDCVFVAVSREDNEIVGFIRLVFNDAGICHVNPVVVYPSWRGCGVGCALMDYAAQHYGELRLVSRGSSLAFYEALGFAPTSWEAIKPEIVAECSQCELYDECNPVPMSKGSQESER
ncbi:MAG: GNAT family N-acetyltransferase [Raoultibacter sp.]